MADLSATYWVLVIAFAASIAALVGLLAYLRRNHAPTPLAPLIPAQSETPAADAPPREG